MIKNSYDFAGYIDCAVITRGWIIGVYKRDGQLYFHRTNKDMTHILEFSPFDQKDYKHDEFVFIEKPIEGITIKGLPIWVLKSSNKVFYGSAQDIDFVNQIKAVDSEIIKKDHFLKKGLKMIIDQHASYTTS